VTSAATRRLSCSVIYPILFGRSNRTSSLSRTGHPSCRATLITRTILPLIWQPSLQPAQTVPFGQQADHVLGLSLAEEAGRWMGVGRGSDRADSDRQQQDARLERVGHRPRRGGRAYRRAFDYGALVNNVLSLGGSTTRGTRYDTFTFNPFVNYNFDGGWFVGTVPIITANWLTIGSKAWTLPLGAQVGRLIKIGGKLLINLLVGAYYNVLRPQYGPTWQLRTQIAVIF
jgi:hypothetical protein